MTFEGEHEPIYRKKVIYNGREFESISDLSRELNISRQAISYACLNNKKVKGKEIKKL